MISFRRPVYIVFNLYATYTWGNDARFAHNLIVCTRGPGPFYRLWESWFVGMGRGIKDRLTQQWNMINELTRNTCRVRFFFRYWSILAFVAYFKWRLLVWLKYCLSDIYKFSHIFFFRWRSYGGTPVPYCCKLCYYNLVLNHFLAGHLRFDIDLWKLHQVCEDANLQMKLWNVIWVLAF